MNAKKHYFAKYNGTMLYVQRNLPCKTKSHLYVSFQGWMRQSAFVRNS